MTQVTKSTIARPIPATQSRRYAAFVAFTAGIIAAAVGGVFIVTSLTAAPTAVRTPQHQDLVDGWMPAVIAAEAARLAQLEDGYLPGLLAARDSGDPVDGYLSGLLAAHDLGDAGNPGDDGIAVDGWESGLRN